MNAVAANLIPPLEPARSSQTVYVPTRAEKARQDFVLGLKLLANGAVQQRVREAYVTTVEPAVTAERGAPPQQRRDVERELARTPEFRHWAALTHASQSQMWRAIEATTRRVQPEAERRYLALRSGAVQPRGSLELDPALHVPPPIGNTEIHRQPGGFVGGPDPDITPGLRYVGASMIYAPGKGNAAAAGDARGRQLAELVAAKFPGLAPRRILDIGCGVGVHAQAVALEFPAAEYHGVDVAAGLLRLGHVLAEERGVPIHFHQRDAAATGFPDGHFDLVISHILFHETNSARLPQILRECRRVLRPGGAMLHLDVATQVTRQGLADQVMNDWQVRWNGEPFWTGFAERDMREQIIAAGFDAGHAFADHQRFAGGNVSYIFGAQA
jgi:SAM-dependent methyltransferase